MFFAKIIEPSSIKGAIVLIDDDFSMIIGANTYNVLQGICIGLLKEERGKVAPPLSLLSRWTRTNLAVYKREELGL